MQHIQQNQHTNETDAKAWVTRACGALPVSAKIVLPCAFLCVIGIIFASLLSKLGRRVAAAAHPDDQTKLLPDSATPSEKKSFNAISRRRNKHIAVAKACRRSDPAKALSHLSSAFAYDIAARTIASNLGAEMEAEPGLDALCNDALEQMRAAVSYANTNTDDADVYDSGSRRTLPNTDSSRTMLPTDSRRSISYSSLRDVS